MSQSIKKTTILRKPVTTRESGAWRFPEDVVAYFQPEYSINQQKIVGTVG
ncbi:hypothetical protein HJG40_05205 [Acidithiobacillus sp. ATCC 19703]|uniref:Uncharacterized protein n=1 Tax=Acidithiobacillus concretivorus TaxID=3063952 RepID=A0ABS5ZPU3_9PROT|nr:hypothetical protein [Acidithiobacillus concretivorus]